MSVLLVVGPPIIGAIAAWALLMLAMRDRRIRRSPFAGLALAFMPLVSGLSAAVSSAIEFQESLQRLSLALTIPAAEASARLVDAMRGVGVSAREAERRLILADARLRVDGGREP